VSLRSRSLHDTAFIRLRHPLFVKNLFFFNHLKHEPVNAPL